MKLYYFPLILFGLLSCKKDDNNKINVQSQNSLISSSEAKKEKEGEFLKSKDLTDTIRNINKVKAVRDSSKYYIYFTLDDGPQLPGTKICKDILEKNNIRATFFMVGVHNTGSERQKLVDSINSNPLFIVSNHSDTHGFRNKYSSFYNNPKSSLQDFITAENKLNIKHKIARLPGRNTWAINKNLKGESSAFGVARKLDSIGYLVYGWDLEWKFIHGNIPVESATEMVKKVKNTLKNGKTYSPNSIIILVHDRMFDKPQYADSLKKFISILKNDNQYVFETLDNYPSLSSSVKTQ